MREERVNLNNVDISKIIIITKQHFLELGLQVIHEDKFENYWSIKAHRGGKLATLTGSIRDVEVLITGDYNNCELTLRTGAWRRDIAIPALLASTISLGGAAAVAAAEIYRAHRFEKNFWNWLNDQISQLGIKAITSPPQVVRPEASTK